MRVLLITILGFLSAPAFAVPVEWHFVDTYLDNGWQVTGSFVFDEDAPFNSCKDDNTGQCLGYTPYYSDLNMQVVDPVNDWVFDLRSPDTITAYIKDDPTPSYVQSNPTAAYFQCWAGDACSSINIPGVPQLNVSWSDALTNAGGTRDVGGAFRLLYVGEFGFSHSIVSGSISSVVPIPATVWLFGSGLMALGGLVRGSRKDSGSV